MRHAAAARLGQRSRVPGAVAGWVALTERFGKLPFADLLAPAIEHRRARLRGAGRRAAEVGRGGAAAAQSQPGFAEAFLPRGRAPQVGELFRFADAARTLRLIAADAAARPTTAARSPRRSSRMRRRTAAR